MNSVGSSNANNADFEQKFRLIIEKIFNNWQNLRLAVEHGMGGRNGQQVAIQIMDYTYQYCIGNKDITEGELQEVLEDLMDQEFNTVCDDNSIVEISRNLLRYKRLCLDGNVEQIESELSKLPEVKDWLRSDERIPRKPLGDDDSSSSDDSDSSDDGEEDMEVDDDGATHSKNSGHKQEEFTEPEPGWTTVRHGRKK